MSGSLKVSKDPSVADSVNSPVLSEYGLMTSNPQPTIERRGVSSRSGPPALPTPAAPTARSPFTRYRRCFSEKIGDQGASLNQRVLFYRGNILVDALFDKLTAMSAAELRDLSQALPQPAGARNLPSLPAYLPKSGYIRNSAKYVMGPVALQKAARPIPAPLVDFSGGAEVALGRYKTSGGEATLMLISYPTPQIAADQLSRSTPPPAQCSAAIRKSDRY